MVDEAAIREMKKWLQDCHRTAQAHGWSEADWMIAITDVARESALEIGLRKVDEAIANIVRGKR